MRENNVEPSECVSWGVRRNRSLTLEERADLLVWRNIDKLPRVERITFRIVKELYCNFSHASPIICTITVEKNQILSEVNSTFSYFVEMNIFTIENVT